MTPAQWAYLGRAHADRIEAEQKFTVDLTSKALEAMRDLLKSLLGSESCLPDNHPEGQFVPLITAIAPSERLEAIRSQKTGANLSPEQEKDFLNRLKEKAATTGGILPPSEDDGAFDGDFEAMFAPYVDGVDDE